MIFFQTKYDHQLKDLKVMDTLKSGNLTRDVWDGVQAFVLFAMTMLP